MCKNNIPAPSMSNNPYKENKRVGTDRKSAVYGLFDALGVKYRVVEHPPMFSQADSEKHRVVTGTVIFKNLFLRNPDGSRYYMLSLPLEKRADLAKVREALGETRLSFGGEDALYEKLRIIPGSVSLLNIVGKPDTDVTFLIDREIMNCESFGVHPNDNTATIIFSPLDLEKIFAHFSLIYRLVET